MCIQVLLEIGPRLRDAGKWGALMGRVDDRWGWEFLTALVGRILGTASDRRPKDPLKLPPWILEFVLSWALEPESRILMLMCWSSGPLQAQQSRVRFCRGSLDAGLRRGRNPGARTVCPIAGQLSFKHGLLWVMRPIILGYVTFLVVVIKSI